MQEALLDVIQTQDIYYKGIVDFCTKKQVIFYDFGSNHNAPELLAIAIHWKMEYPMLRFSVFKAKFYPHVAIQPPVVIAKKAITDSYKELGQTSFERKTKRITSS